MLTRPVCPVVCPSIVCRRRPAALVDVTMSFHKWAVRPLLVAVLLHVILYVVPALLDDPWLGLIEL